MPIDEPTIEKQLEWKVNEVVAKASELQEIFNRISQVHFQVENSTRALGQTKDCFKEQVDREILTGKMGEVSNFVDTIQDPSANVGAFNDRLAELKTLISEFNTLNQ